MSSILGAMHGRDGVRMTSAPIEEAQDLAPKHLSLALRADVLVQIGPRKTRLHPLARRGAVAVGVLLVERPMKLGELALDDDAAHLHETLRFTKGQRLHLRAQFAEHTDGPLESPHHLGVRLEVARKTGAKAHPQTLRALIEEGEKSGSVASRL